MVIKILLNDDYNTDYIKGNRWIKPFNGDNSDATMILMMIVKQIIIIATKLSMAIMSIAMIITVWIATRCW